MILVRGVLGAAVVDVVALERLVDAVAAALAKKAGVAVGAQGHLGPDGPEALLAHRFVGRQEAGMLQNNNSYRHKEIELFSGFPIVLRENWKAL